MTDDATTLLHLLQRTPGWYEGGWFNVKQDKKTKKALARLVELRLVKVNSAGLVSKGYRWDW